MPDSPPEPLDLVEFLEARLRDEETEASAATPGPWRYNPRKQWLTEPDAARRALLVQIGVRGEEFVAAGPLDEPVCVAATGPADDPQSMLDASFVARHDPARALREVEAKRRLLAMRVEDEYGYTRARFGDFESCSDSCPGTIVDEVLKLLALPYSDHPDWRDEWNPTDG